jgi:hypothetical protein
MARTDQPTQTEKTMTEEQAKLSYIAMGLIVGLIASTVAVFLVKKDGGDNASALLASGAFGALLGGVWPVTVAALVGGSIGLGVWTLYSLVVRKFN